MAGSVVSSVTRYIALKYLLVDPNIVDLCSRSVKINDKIGDDGTRTSLGSVITIGERVTNVRSLPVGLTTYDNRMPRQ